MQIFVMTALLLATNIYSAEQKKGVKHLFRRRHSLPEPIKPLVTFKEEEPIVDKDFLCESARYNASPTARYVFEKLMHRIRSHKHMVSKEDVQLYQDAFNYNPHTDDPKLPLEQDRRRMCALNKCLKLFMTCAHDELELVGFEAEKRRKEMAQEIQFDRQRMQSQLEHMQSITALAKEKNQEKEALVQQVLAQHTENTRLAYVTLGVSTAVAFTSMGFTAYALLNGKVPR